MIIQLLLLVFALVFFIIAGLGIPNPPRFQFLGWGLACLTGYFITVITGMK
jgi:hypothetical protein